MDKHTDTTKNVCGECRNGKTTIYTNIYWCEKQNLFVNIYDHTSDCKEFEPSIDIMDCTDESSPMSD